ncbi:MAG: rod shape-determining protein MreC [Desulfobacterales bacterium]|nr:rod shape-determining protein MreC [Desulfobacterales bacterium]
MSNHVFTLLYRFIFVAIVTIALIILDHRTSYFDWTRSVLSNVNAPFNTVLSVPVRMGTFFEDYWPNEKLRQQVDFLEFENQRLLAKVQKYDALEVEKNRLLVLFSAGQARGDAVIKMARIIRAELQGPYDQRIVIDHGSRDDVILSQPVIDANGVIGQLSKIAYNHSVVTVITDASHATPVEILRNGLRAVARGTGNSQILKIPFMSFQADIEVGDVLVTSGLGEVFPAGYPVAEVSSIQGLAGEPFLTIEARPFAEMNKVKNILLLDQPLITRKAASENSLKLDDAEPQIGPVESQSKPSLSQPAPEQQ